MKVVKAQDVHGRQVIEWLGMRCVVLSTDHEPTWHSRHRKYGRVIKRAGVALRVRPDAPDEPIRWLHYWADEEVAVLGWSLGGEDNGTNC